MGRRASLDQRLGELERLSRSPDEDDAAERLGALLAGTSSVVVARAAALTPRVRRRDWAPELAAAFRRFLVDPAKTDKGCMAKLAVVEALLACDDPDEEVFRAGLTHVQLEPTWGRLVDTAAQLRARCALGLVQVGASGVLDDLAVLLADPEPDARLGAARALAACGEAATPLLRLKALTGDEEPLVTGECLGGLMTAAPRGSFDFVAALVDPERPDVAGHAALALAEARVPGTWELLRERWEASLDADFRAALLLPLALTRHDDAPSFLLSVLSSADLGVATTAVAALAIYRDLDGLRERAEAALGGPHRGRLLRHLGEAFG